MTQPGAAGEPLTYLGEYAVRRVLGEGGMGVVYDATERLSGRRPLFVVDVGTRGLKDDGLAAIIGLAPRRVVLRGTNPRSLARNVAAFTARGWELRRVLTYDVSPHTPFVEIVAVLHSADRTAPERRAPRRRTVR